MKKILMFVAILALCGCASAKSNTEVNNESIMEEVPQEEIVVDDESIEDITEASQEEVSTENNPSIVWLGDSLTQGSLGDEYDNLPGAPCVLLMNKHGLDVDGYGFYGYDTGTVLWCYKDEERENQTVDPKKVYIFWLGSNDWVVAGEPNTDAESVITKLDDFINNGQLDKYIVMGTTARYELRVEEDGQFMYEIINDKLKNHYKEHYMDVIDIIGDDGYGPDQIHLKASTYEKVSEMVYNKLIDMGYVK